MGGVSNRRVMSLMNRFFVSLPPHIAVDFAELFDLIVTHPGFGEFRFPAFDGGIHFIDNPLAAADSPGASKFYQADADEWNRRLTLPKV